jgi:hypothetical protein
MTLDSLVPHRGSSFSSCSHISNAGLTFFISVQIASHQRLLPFCLSIAIACSADFGIRIPNLCVRCQYLDLNLDRILLRFLITFPTYQAKAGSSSIWLEIAYSATRTGYERFASFRATQLVLPSFHWHNICHPCVVWRLLLTPFFIIMKASSLSIASAITLLMVNDIF